MKLLTAEAKAQPQETEYAAHNIALRFDPDGVRVHFRFLDQYLVRLIAIAIETSKSNVMFFRTPALRYGNYVIELNLIVT